MALRRRHVHADARLHAQHALRRALAITPVLLAGLWFAPAASAQVSVEASPLRVEVQTEPGGTHTQAVTLTNPGTRTVRVRTTLSDWHLAKDGAPQFETPQAGRPFAAASWVRFAPPELTLEPGKQGTVRFTLTVPADAQPGGYRTGLLFEFFPEGEDPRTASRQIVFRSRIASIIYVNVGQTPATVELTNLQIRNAAETQIVAALKNSSRRTVRTKGTLMLYDKSGMAVAQITVPDVPVLPESERELAVAATEAMKPLPAGDYRVELKLDLGMPALLVGETTLRVAR